MPGLGTMQIQWKPVDISSVSAKPGDTVVFMTDYLMTDESKAAFVDSVRHAFPCNPIIVLQEGMRIGVVNKDNATDLD